MIYDAVYKGSLAKGAQERRAKDAAVQAVQKFGRSDFKKLHNLINDGIKEALKK